MSESNDFSDSRTSDDDLSSSNRTGTSDGTGTASKAPELARSESALVFRLRILVFVALFIAAVTVSAVVYWITSKAEDDQFQSQFAGAAAKMISSFQEVVGQKVGAIDSLAVTATAFARSQNETWPFVTMNDFQQRAASARSLSDALFLEVIPLVTDDTRREWEKYSVKNKAWVDEGRAYQDALGLGDSRRLQTGDFFKDSTLNFSSGISDRIYLLDETWQPALDKGPGPYYPIWQSSPVIKRDLVNYNLDYYPDYAPYIKKSMDSGQLSMGGISVTNAGNKTDPNLATSFYAFILSFAAGKDVGYLGDPMSSVYVPIFDSFEDDRKTVAIILAVINWATYFNGILPPNSEGLDFVLSNTCDGPFTYRVSGKSISYTGAGSLHDTRFDSMLEEANLDHVLQKGQTKLDLTLNQDICAYSIKVYPAPDMYSAYHTAMPFILTGAVGCVFVFTALMFLLYNFWVERRQRLVMHQAVQSTAIVSSLFPEAVRDKLMESRDIGVSGKTRLRSFLDAGENDEEGLKPIADLFPDATVSFADIAGFTAWSSTRDPAQVFILLQTIYQAFDVIAKRRKVFKVETIGDSYVAVAGLPTPNEKHAIAMARFATECLEKFNELTSELEVALGPDTGDLKLRLGMHSGPVTAGVLRGDRSRFQLFGDTVNTASRMESAGVPNRIQCSASTAALLQAADKGHWLLKRTDPIVAKGKGMMETYWVCPRPKKEGSVTSEQSGEKAADFMPVLFPKLDSLKRDRLVDWNVDLLLSHIRKIVAYRKGRGIKSEASSLLTYFPSVGDRCIDEVAEIIRLPKFNAKAMLASKKAEKIEFDPRAVSQLREVVATIAAAYADNPFHNFEHACHVTMCVDKFLQRIVNPDIEKEDSSEGEGLSNLHDYTHGINSDPLTMFAIVFSALIHDVDHRGVSNMQLGIEHPEMADYYKNKSIAEQNSLDLAWSVLMDPNYEALRAMVFANRAELMRFRQILVNMVMATDIFDKELNELRKARWNKAFSEDVDDEIHHDLRATIVIEHIIQASDVSHTMQHWHIYRKWNERLFMEMYKAFKQGRMAKSPAEFWYKGELGFYDNYIIPLAKKLKECNVFGVSSDECLNYAIQNRSEWEARGQEVVESMMEKVEAAGPVPVGKEEVETASDTGSEDSTVEIVDGIVTRLKI